MAMSMGEIKQTLQQLAGCVNIANALCVADNTWDQATVNDPSNGEFTEHIKANLEQVVKAMQACCSRLANGFERARPRVHTD